MHKTITRTRRQEICDLLQGTVHRQASWYSVAQSRLWSFLLRFRSEITSLVSSSHSISREFVVTILLRYRDDRCLERCLLMTNSGERQCPCIEPFLRSLPGSSITTSPNVSPMAVAVIRASVSLRQCASHIESTSEFWRIHWLGPLPHSYFPSSLHHLSAAHSLHLTAFISY